MAVRDEMIELQRRVCVAAILQFQKANGRPCHIRKAIEKLPFAGYEGKILRYIPEVAEEYGYGVEDEYAALAEVYQEAAEIAERVKC